MKFTTKVYHWLQSSHSDLAFSPLRKMQDSSLWPSGPLGLAKVMHPHYTLYEKKIPSWLTDCIFKIHLSCWASSQSSILIVKVCLKTSVCVKDLILLGTVGWQSVCPTQQDYYNLWYDTLLHSYYTCTYTEVTVLLLWSISTVTM